MIVSMKWRDAATPRFPSECFTGMEILAVAGAAASVASAGMGIIGAGQQADAQRQAGEIAYQNALLRNQALESQAKQREADANAAEAASQRQAIETRRKSTLAASRAKAVMAASGAGVDETILADILGEGEYGFETSLYEGKKKGQDLRYQASLNRYEGKTGIYAGEQTRSAMNARADNTETMGIVGAGLKLGSMAAKYAGPAPGDGIYAASPGDTYSAYGSLPNSYRAPGFDDKWNAV